MEKLGDGKDFNDRNDSGSGSLSDGAVFDASQYSFFGKDVIDVVELGGLEDEEEEGVPVLGGGLGDEEELQEYHLFGKNEFHHRGWKMYELSSIYEYLIDGRMTKR